MNRLRKIIGSVVASAIMLTSVTPALARPGGWGGGWGGGWDRGGGWGHRHYRHRNRVDAGDVIAGVVIIGAIAAIASAASRSTRDRDAGPGGSYPGGSNRDWDRDRDDDRIVGEQSAIDACATAAEDEASRNDRAARVDDITSVSRNGDGYRVEGVVSVQRGRYGDKTAFVCATRDGRVDYVRLEGRDDTDWN